MNTVAERICRPSHDTSEQIEFNASSFTSSSVGLNESTEATYSAQLAVFIKGVDDKFEVTEELLSVIWCMRIPKTSSEMSKHVIQGGEKLH